MKKNIFKGLLVVLVLLVAVSVFALSGLITKKQAEGKNVEKEQIVLAKDENINKTINVESNLPEPKEKYVEQVIKKFTWGNGEGELGLEKKVFMRSETGEITNYYYLGPSAICLDEKENIYILDPANKCIQLFDNNGKFISRINLELSELDEIDQPLFQVIPQMKVDNAENIYINTDYTSMLPVILKINKKGKIVNRYVSLSKLNTNKYSRIKKKNFLQKDNTVDISAIGLNSININKGVHEEIILYSDNEYVNLSNENISRNMNQENILDRTLIKSYAKLNEINDISEIKNENSNIMADKLPIKIKKQFKIPEEIKRKYGCLFYVYHLNEDIKHNKYFELIFRKDSKIKRIIFKYDCTWEIKCIFEIPIVSQGIYEVPFIIGNSGNIYQLIWDDKKLDERATLIKWISTGTK